MKILCLTLEQTTFKRPDILDWLTSSEIKKGINHERYWIIDVNTVVEVAQQEYEVDKINNLLQLTKMYDYNLIMIIK